MVLRTPGLDEFPEEAAVIGRLLTGYGELEYALCVLLGDTLNDVEVAVKVMFRNGGEEGRIQIADALMRYKFEQTPIADAYKQTISDMQHCRKIRNQFAHSLFEGTTQQGTLSFVDLEESARAPGMTRIEAVPIALPLLEAQEEYFGYVQDRLLYLSAEFQLQEGRTSSHGETLPATIAKPRRHGADW